MIVSHPNRSFAAFVIGGAICGWLTGCHTPGALPIAPAVDSQVRFSVRVPDVADHAAADLAVAALLSDRDRALQILDRLKKIDTLLVTGNQKPTGLVPIATDLVNATLNSERARHDAIEELLDQGDLDPALRERLRQEEKDHPLELADARIRDARVISFARAFNSIAEPIGQSLMTLTLAPIRLAQSVLHYAIRLHTTAPLPLQRRQALGYWKQFVSRYPDSPAAAALHTRIEEAEGKLIKTRYEELMRASKRALQARRVRLSLIYSQRALQLIPEDDAASELHEQANSQLLTLRAKQQRSVSGVAILQPSSAAERRLAESLLNPGGDIADAARELIESNSDGSLHDEAHFAQALALGESGSEHAMWELIEDLADQDHTESNMARHARRWTGDPTINPYEAYADARSLNRQTQAKWLFLGPFARGLPDRHLPTPVEFIIDLPAIAQSMMSTPIRLLQMPWRGVQPAERLAAVYGRRYLQIVPGGEHTESIRHWLFDFEEERENWIGVYQIALDDPEIDREELGELREQAAEQAMEIASHERSRSFRNTMYRRAAREYPDTVAGQQCGNLARREFREATPQHIRISRGFLSENPQFAGPRGLGLDARLLDEDHANSELHPTGVILTGGRVLELHFIGPTGDEDDPPLIIYQEVSEQRFTRIVASLEETSFRNSLLDTEDAIAADANRDVMFERARVGLADEIDRRPEAESTFSYLGMRERYGLIRSRQSILPFELVFQGSLSSFSMGAFPRIHSPRETPDAFLYR